MKRQEAYNAWKERKSQIEISRDFPDKVMNHIYQYEQQKTKSFFDAYQFIELISAHSLAKAALVTVGAVVGFIRIVFVVYMFLGC